MAEKSKDIKRVVVTGAAGAVGRYLISDLAGRGYGVRGVDIRSPRFPVPPGVELLECDLTDPSSAARVVSGADAVIHTAALVDISLGYDALHPLNVEAVRNLYIRSAAAGVRRFVHFSSGSVYGPAPGGVVDEDAPLVATSAYERTKIESEEVLRELHHDLGLDWIVIRPSLIYGPGARFLAADLAAIPPALRFVFGKNVPGFRGGPRTNLVHAEDVARAAVFLMDKAAAQRAYNVADPTPLDAGTLFTSAVRAWGIDPAFTIPLPEPGTLRPFRPLLDSDLFFRAANAPIGPIWSELVEEHGLTEGLNPAFDRESAPYMFNDTVFSVDRLRVRGFRWKHPDFRKSIASVLRWYEDNRWIPRITEVEPGAGRTPRLGFSFTETMSGRVKLLDDAIQPPTDEGRPFMFTVTARTLRFERFLRNWETRLEGILYWEGMADGAPITGKLHIPLLTQRQLHYDFAFSGEDGRTYRFKGRKDVDLLRLLDTMTTLPGRVLDDDDREVARGVARFDLRKDLLPMVASFSLL